MKQVLETIIKSLVDNEDAVEVTENKQEKSVTYQVRVANDDIGKIIGKQGKVAKAIRTVMKSIAGKEQRRVNVEFLDD